MTITAHCLVKNEENYIWFAINSILDSVDKVMVWDMGSTDNTIPIIKSIKSEKIIFGKTDGSVSSARQAMLDATDSDWVLILDGDEIWWKDSIAGLVDTMQSTRADVIVVSNYMCIGDIFHYQEKRAGRYKIWDKSGTVTVRAFRRNIKELKVAGEYPQESYVNGQGVRIQELPKEKIYFSNLKYIHTSFLRRTSVENKKIKYEFGIPVSTDFYFPEVLFLNRPDIVKSPWQLPDFKYKMNAFVQTPFKKIKRKFFTKGVSDEN